MNSRVLLLALFTLTICSSPLAWGEGEKPSAGSTNTNKVKPLRLEDKPLLLLEDAPTNAPAALADNSRCHVCHLNFAQEQLAVTHARTNIGCMKCHGPSDAHIADESWASGGNGTAPDIMFPKEKINPSCRICHELRKLSQKEHLEFLSGGGVQKYCTDCHGKHRLAKRKCKWK